MAADGNRAGRIHHLAGKINDIMVVAVHDQIVPGGEKFISDGDFFFADDGGSGSGAETVAEEKSPVFPTSRAEPRPREALPEKLTVPSMESMVERV